MGLPRLPTCLCCCLCCWLPAAGLQVAAAESRLQRLERQSLLMRAQLARLKGQAARVTPLAQTEK